ncbi:hypothetical protein F4778DRAFT_766044 [Xylariomycetidae sp. FL2044]|nr:hypothetical protein F4778DRAFT_766044 [Xylariomycetidae sp. FL2044]
MPDFAFVNVANPDDVRKHSTQIRRHVMKDIGKARRRPKKRPAETTVTEQVIITPGEQQQPEETRSASSSSCMMRRERSGHTTPPLVMSEPRILDPRIDSGVSSVVFPVEMDEERLQLFRFIFAEARDNYAPFRFPWLTMGLSDPAAWHITMANVVLYRKARTMLQKKEYVTSPEAMKWYTLSLESITRRLASPTEAYTEGLAVAVAGFVCHDGAVGNFTRQAVHLNGLKRIVEQKGGLEALHSPILRTYIPWLDLTGATYRNVIPNFEVPKTSITDFDTGDDLAYLEQLLRPWEEEEEGADHLPVLADVAGALRATAKVASYIRRYRGQNDFWQDDMTAARLLTPALHRTLSLPGRPLPADPADPSYAATAAREAFRRAALVFLAAVKLRLGTAAPELAGHLDAFQQISQLPRVDWAAVVAPELSLWAHLTAALQLQGSSSGGRSAWHAFAAVGLMGALGLRTSADAVAVARRIIWVEALGEVDGKLAALCREIDSLVGSNAVGGIRELPVQLRG